MRLFPRRQLQVAAERSSRLIDGEPRLHRRDLEQHAAGLAEIDRREVAAIAHVGDADAELRPAPREPRAAPPRSRSPSPRGARCRGRSPRSAHRCLRSRRSDGPAASPPAATRVRFADCADDAIAEHPGQEVDRRLRLPDHHLHAVQPANRALLAPTIAVHGARVVAIVRDQLEPQPARIVEARSPARRSALRDRRRDDARLAQADGARTRANPSAPRNTS